MDFKDYQEKAHSTSQNTTIQNNLIIYPLMGLGGESGEIFEKFKKLFRDKNGIIDNSFKEEITKELGDVLWYVAEICTQMGISLDDVASKNIEKLFSRKDRGKINGSGDNR